MVAGVTADYCPPVTRSLAAASGGRSGDGTGTDGSFVSPAFGYAGVGFPTVGMNAFAQVWSTILPLRWYMAVLLGQAARGLPFPIRRSLCGARGPDDAFCRPRIIAHGQPQAQGLV